MHRMSHLDALLFLRVAATCVVVFGHAASFFDSFAVTQWPQVPYIQSGAVTIFFAVSGYTIAWVCDRRSDGPAIPAFGKFVFDRYARLTIPLIPTLLLFWCVEALVLGAAHPYGDSLTVWNAVGNALMLQNLAPGVTPFGLNRPLWTIGLEFWTYLTFAGFFFAVRGGGRMFWLPLIGSLVAAALLSNNLIAGRGAGLPIIWLLGVGLYFVLRDRPDLSSAGKLCLLPIAVLTFFGMGYREVWPPDGGYTMTYNLMIFGNFAIFMLIGRGLAIPLGMMRATKSFSDFAYTWYLTHYPLMQIARQLQIGGSGELAAISAVVISLTFAYGFSIPLEQRYKVIRGWLWSRVQSRR